MTYPWLIERFVLPTIDRFTSSRFPSLALCMQRFDRLGSDEIRSQQWELLCKIIRHAYGSVPFYRQRFEESGLDPADIHDPEDLAKLPTG